MGKLKVLELFAGIGACSKALKNLNIDFEIVDAVEKDKWAIASFNAIHNTDFEVQDIRKWNKNIKVDLIMHGSPCQDFSTAGKNKGGDEGSGTRSSLMYETIRIVESLNPKYVVWENVKNLLSKRHKHNFENYINKMEKLGYVSYYQVLNAKEHGIPQNRERIFVVSINKYIVQKAFEFPEKEELKIYLKDLLEKNVDEKYYLSKEQIERLKVNSDQERLLLRNATKKGYIEAVKGDSVWLDFPLSETKRGRVGKGVSQTLSTKDTMGVVVGDSILISYPKTPKKRIWKGVARCLTTQSDQQGVFVN